MGKCNQLWQNAVDTILLEVRALNRPVNDATTELIYLGIDPKEAEDMTMEAELEGIEENSQFGVGA